MTIKDEILKLKEKRNNEIKIAENKLINSIQELIYKIDNIEFNEVNRKMQLKFEHIKEYIINNIVNNNFADINFEDNMYCIQDEYKLHKNHVHLDFDLMKYFTQSNKIETDRRLSYERKMILLRLKNIKDINLKCEKNGENNKAIIKIIFPYKDYDIVFSEMIESRNFDFHVLNNYDYDCSVIFNQNKILNKLEKEGLIANSLSNDKFIIRFKLYL